jgi:hypothetical protein
MAFVLVVFGLFTISLFNFSSHKEDKLYNDLFNNNYRIFSVQLPIKLEFCNEKVPLSNFDVRERLDREMLVNVYWQSQTLLFHKRAARWFPIIEPILKRNNVPDDFKYLSLIESGFVNVVSPSDAVGFWQFLEETGKRNGLEITSEIDERYNVEASTEAACRYILEAKQKLGSWTMAAASYNMGVTGIKKHMDYQENQNYYDLMLNMETSRYVFRILAIKEIMEHPKKYGFYIRKKDLYPPIKTQKIIVDSSITDLAKFAKSQQVSYKILKIFNPWLRDKTLTNKLGKTYFIQIPLPGYEDYENLLEEAGTRGIDTAYALDYEDLIEQRKVYSSILRVHKVKNGETVESISKIYNCEPILIRERNKIKPLEQPAVNTELIIGC